MPTEQVIDQEAHEREAFTGVLRFYELAKRQEWQEYITQVSQWELDNYLAKY